MNKRSLLALFWGLFAVFLLSPLINAAWLRPVSIGTPNSGYYPNDISVGDGRNDGNNSVYTGTNDGKVFEFRWDFTSNNYTIIDMGRYSAFCSSPITCGHDSYRNFISLGNIRNDSFGNRIYSVVSDSYHAFEYSWSSADNNWTISDIGNVSSSSHLMNTEIGPGRNDSVNRFYIASMSPVESRAYLLSTFNDSEVAKTLYANGTEKAYINIPKNATIAYAIINMSKVDLGIANYISSSNLYTLSVRNTTNETLVAGTNGYVALMNKTNGAIIQEIPSGTSSYIWDSAFKPDGTEAVLVTDNGQLLKYDASAKTITSSFASNYYLTGVSYSHSGTFAIAAGDWNGPIIIYNATTGAVSNLSLASGGTGWIEAKIDISPDGQNALIVGLQSQFSIGIAKYNITCAIENINTNNWASCSSTISSIQTNWRDVSYNPSGTGALIVGDKGMAEYYNATSGSVTNLTSGTKTSLRSVSYTPDGSKALITGFGGVAFIFNSTCNPNLCNVTTSLPINLNSVEFDSNANAFISGSGKTLLKYNNTFTTLRNGTSGILYYVKSKPNSTEALIVGDEGLAFKYNFTSKLLTTLNSGVTFSLKSVAFNWNATEALVVGDSGIVLRYTPSNDSFARLNTPVNSSLISVSYQNGTNNALISGDNSVLLAYNSSCDGVANSLCQITNLPASFPTSFPILTVSFSPNGGIALMGAWGRMMRYNSTNGSIEMVEGNNASGTGVVMWPHSIAWKPDGTIALVVGDSGSESFGLGCSSGVIGAIAIYNSSVKNITETYCFGNNYLESVAFSSDGKEALIGGRRGDLGQFNSTIGNLSNGITTLKSGTNGILWGVDYIRDNVNNEAVFAVGENNQVLFYDGVKVLTDPQVLINNTDSIFYETGTYTKTSSQIIFTGNLTSYLSSCSQKEDGTCDVPVFVNSSSPTALMKLHNINISYSYTSSITASDTIYEYSWNNASQTWNITNFPYAPSQGFYAVSVGKGRNDSVDRVYGANGDGKVYEYTWDASLQNWTVLDIGNLSSSQLYNVFVGDGRNDSVIRVYAASSNGHGYEYSWNGTGFNITDMGRVGIKMYSATNGVGRNDAKLRLYSSDKSYQIDELTYNSGWSIVRVGATTNGAYYSDDVKIIDVKNDNVMRVYSTRTDGSLYVNEYFTGFDDPIHLYEDYLSGTYIINFTWTTTDYVSNPLFAEMVYAQDGGTETVIQHINDVKTDSLCFITERDASNNPKGGYCMITWNTTTVPDGANYILINRMGDGIHTVQRETSKEFTIDNTLPFYRTIEINPPDNSGYIASPYNFMIDSDDATAGINSTILSFDGTNYTAQLIDGKYQVDVSGISLGTYSYYWIIRDNAGNVNTTTIQNYTVRIIYSFFANSQNAKTFNDFNLPFSVTSYVIGNLTYRWLLDTDLKSSTTAWTYSPLTAEIGDHSLQLTVNDSVSGMNDSHEWNVSVWLQGDTNNDKKVNIFDLAKIGYCYGCSSSQECWSSCLNGNVDSNNKIDIFDLARVGKRYGTNLIDVTSQKTLQVNNATQYIYQYDYSASSANVTFYVYGNTFYGQLVGSKLKPNFTYQMKIEGKPFCLYDINGSNSANSKIGYIGRWWDHDYCTTTCNINDAWVESHPDNCIQGYDLFDYFNTDGDGNIIKDFSLAKSYHVLWCSAPEGGTNNNHLNNGTCASENLWAEPERGDVSMTNGYYNLRFLLTEESFHNSSTGQWPTVLTADDIKFRIQQ